MINVLVNGCNGKMGREVINQIDSYPNMLLSCGFDVKDEGQNSFPVYKNTLKIQGTIDVIIDFSVPVSTLNILKYAKEKHIPIVIATTGFTDEELNVIKDYSNYIIY